MTISNFTSRPLRTRRIVGTLNVADLARQAEVTPATIRYYARIGLLNPGRDERNGYRRFSHEDLRRVAFIRKAQGLGLTIGDIHSVLERVECGRPVCDLVVGLVEKRLDEVRRQCAELEATRVRMADALSRWSAAARDDRHYDGFCTLIEEVDCRGAKLGLERRGLCASAG
jgi:DNA-binding transcriptional MerR regulator